MAKSRYTFDKRQREKAKRLKQIEKISKRMMAKKQKANADGEIPGENSDATDLESGSPSASDSRD